MVSYWMADCLDFKRVQMGKHLMGKAEVIAI